MVQRSRCPRTVRRTWFSQVVIVAVLGTLLWVPVTLSIAPAASAAPCDTPVVNAVACENTNPGAPAGSWRVQSNSENIAGFSTDISVNRGQSVGFKVRTDASNYRLDIYRLGWYGGTGARKVTTLNRTTAQAQPACLVDAATTMTDCGNWAVSLTWQVPADAVSGIYYGVLTRPDTGEQNEIVFVVRDDASTADVLFQTSDSTWQAYNRFGGTSLYTGSGPGDSGSGYAVSYNRPIENPGEENFIFNAEYPMLRFLEANGYDLSYSTDVDTARRGELIRNHAVFMPVGHDEYWSNEQRASVEAARAAGVDLAFFTANEIFWKTVWKPSIDASATPWRSVVTYKDTKGNQRAANTTGQWTGTWRDARFSPPSNGGRPENALLGNMFTVNGRRDDSLVVPAEYGKMRLWRNTALANLDTGQSHTFAPGTLGYEWNSVVDNGFTPPGLVQMSRTTVTMEGQWILQNEGDLYGSGTQTHALTLYRDQTSGSLVFGAGTVQWAWGLDDDHAFSTGQSTVDVRMQQATVNLLADMGAQPATRRPGLVAAAASTDTTAPTVTIADPAAATVGTPYTISGSVSDTGGRVAGVEVSFDDGTTWKQATWLAGATTWSATFTPTGSGTASVKVRAVDDSARLSPTVSANVAVGARTCPCTIFRNDQAPPNPSVADPTALELGVKFRADADGFVRGVRFYKGAANTGTHTGSLWTTSGQRLATGTFVNETASGWQTLLFPTSVAVTAGTTYVASYHTDTGRYPADNNYFASKDVRSEPLTALRNGTDGPNGVYRVGASGFPDESFNASNYWVDVVYALDPGPDTRAPEIASTAPTANAGSVRLDAPVTVTTDEPVLAASVQFGVTGPGGAAVPGTVSLSGDRKVVTFTPGQLLTAGSAHTVTFRANDLAGNAMAAPLSFGFTTGSPRGAICPCSVWDDFSTPAIFNATDSAPIELGARVRFDVRGEVLGVRFYKGPSNTGTHTGSLWTASGQRLATGTFTGETGSGWQTLTFSSPVAVSANTPYVVSYHAPSGRYSLTQSGLAQSADYQFLHALRDGDGGGNGLYRYGTGGGFPTGSFNSTNYWVDVVFRNGANGDTTPPTLTARTPAVDALGVPTTAAVTATFSEPVDPGSVQFTLADPAGTRVAGTASVSADGRTVTLAPAAALAPSTRYTTGVRVSDVNGNIMPASAAWAFTTTTTAVCPCSLFSAATVPTVEASADTAAYELGVRFSASQRGEVRGIRFYKGPGNTGPHTGSLWTGGGQLLATGTFVDETATGWQTLVLASPVRLIAGSTYVASYTTTTGRYALDSEYFLRTAVTSGTLSAPGSGNGVYRPGSGFPTDSFRGGNYWVDVVFGPLTDTDETPPTVTDRTPAPSAVEVVPAGTSVTATFDEPVATGAQLTLADPGGARIGGTTQLSPDRRTLTFVPGAALAAGTTYTASASASDLSGNSMTAPTTWSFTVTGAVTCPCGLFSAATVPTILANNDPNPYELGVRFSPAVDGQITGVRFHKGEGNTGTHTGSLWTAGGQLLATGTFVDETNAGWQTLVFIEPVPVTAGETYVASYATTAGRYSSDNGYFTRTSVTGPPLAAPAFGNGVYRTGSGFPTDTYRGGNYWVDVVFRTGP